MNRRLDIAYYYPAPYWGMREIGWVKSLLLFFDRIAILLPDYMYGRHHMADPALAEPLEDQGLLEVLEPTTWVDHEMTTSLAEVVNGLLANGVFDDLSTDVHYHELSRSRLGYGADVDLAVSLVSKLQDRGLARPSEDGVSAPLHPIVRTTILVILAQLARSAGNKQNLSVHPATNDRCAIQDLIDTLSRDRMPSRDKVIAFDLEPVSFDLESVPLDELLQFRAEHHAEHRAYMRDLRGFMAELGEISDPAERESQLLQRRQEISAMAHDLQRSTRSGLGRKLASFSLGLTGSVWSVIASDPIGFVLAASGLAADSLGLKRTDSNTVAAYSYLFRLERAFQR